MIERMIGSFVTKVLNEWGKSVLLSGPRQVGKTTLGKKMLSDSGQGMYFNWDIVTDQAKLVRDPYFFQALDRDLSRPSLVVLDEIHKYSGWIDWLKGAYDGFGNEFRFLATGSGRLDCFRKGADSLMGRAVGVPLFPLSVGEILGRFPSWDEFRAGLAVVGDPIGGDREAYERLSRFGGFPEPFVRGEDAFMRVWHQERMTMLVRQDIRDATRIRDISMLETLTHLIPSRVGSPLSINSLREDLHVAFETVRDWVRVLDQFYYLFTVTPWSKSVSRAITKEGKTYLFDWVDVPGDGPRFENMVATHLHKAVGSWRATGSGAPELNFVKDKEKREVDFLLSEAGRPLCLIECKHGDESPAPSLTRFQDMLGVPVAVQLTDRSGICREYKSAAGTCLVISAERWLSKLP